MVEGSARPGDYRGVPRRRQHHAMGLCAAGRACRRSGRCLTRMQRALTVRGARFSCPCVMTFPDICPAAESASAGTARAPVANEPLAPLTWFRVGGPAQALFMPEDEGDLAYLLAHLPPEIPVTVIGLGSNLIVRDGGVAGVVDPARRAASTRSRSRTTPRARGHRGARRASVATAAQEAGDRRARVLSRHSRRDRRRAAHERRRLWRRDQGRADRGARRRPRRQRPRLRQRRHGLHLSPLRRAGRRHLHRRRCSRARPAIRRRSRAEMDEITKAREATQPIKSRTGGSTFKNPPGHKAWQLIDAAGCRGLSSATRRSRSCTAIS